MTLKPTQAEVDRVARQLIPKTKPERNVVGWLLATAFTLGFMFGMLIMGCIR